MDRLILACLIQEVFLSEKTSLDLLAQCALGTYGFFPGLSAMELFIVFGVLYHVLRHPSIEESIFGLLMLQNKKIPILGGLRFVAVYGLKEMKKVCLCWKKQCLWAYTIGFVGLLAGGEYLLIKHRFSVNARRKLLHFWSFAYVSIFPASVVRVQIIGATAAFLVFLRVLSAFRVSEKTVFSLILSEKDRRGVISPIVFLCGLCFSLELLLEEREKFLFVISSVCLLDGIASFFAKSKSCSRTGHKTLHGSMIGAVCTKIALSCMGIEYPMYMYLSLGLTECFTGINDNISLPIVAYMLVHNYPYTYRYISA
ncbi:hypothetical protein NECID01_0359 [Nematocida sp. AWRm77]|nr:hypothetical protein NECID01_0359 [Nematocida sp. AWRm77]